MEKLVAKLRLGQTGDASRPLGWKKIAKKCKTNLDVIREVRRSEEYYRCVSKICSSIGMARLQAKAARKNRSLGEWIENAFGLDIYSARILADELDPSDLPFAAGREPYITEERAEELAQEADELITGSSNTIALNRKHIKWLIEQGYADSDMMVLRAATMTRCVYSRTKPKFITDKEESNQ